MSDAAGTLVENVVRFARLLRAAGLPVGPGRALEAVRAVGAVGVASKADLYWSLHATLVNRREQRDVFDQAFRLFWRDPKLLERAMGMLLPSAVDPDADEPKDPTLRRVGEPVARLQSRLYLLCAPAMRRSAAVAAVFRAIPRLPANA